MFTAFPSSQGELIRMARGPLSQAQFAVMLGVDRSCLSRYEGEKLGAPTSVLNYCLRRVGEALVTQGVGTPAAQALDHVQRAAQALMEITKSELVELRPTKRKATARRPAQRD